MREHGSRHSILFSVAAIQGVGAPRRSLHDVNSKEAVWDDWPDLTVLVDNAVASKMATYYRRNDLLAARVSGLTTVAQLVRPADVLRVKNAGLRSTLLFVHACEEKFQKEAEDYEVYHVFRGTRNAT
ncbi:hypothetical protein NDU88_002592 [Pleurodeles waltl]|uniref:Uncharacterized protein n=1 Tax=Pleurodeles waltl TaxID=8319 RepID=A0AAV7SCG3_PLEWA|nr:hypothetical protein NDU88_002592 [Pleurodeles waltl]